MKRFRVVKTIGYGLLLAGFAMGTAYAAGGAGGAQTIGTIATQITKSFTGIGRLIIAGSFIAGMGFAVGAVLKFKQHKDNPTQIPVGTPVALIFIAAALIFLPRIFESAGKTIFNTTQIVGGPRGNWSFLTKNAGGK